MKKFFTTAAFALALLVGLPFVLGPRDVDSPSEDQVEEIIGIVASSDKSIYVINLTAGNLIAQTRPVESLGKPTAIAVGHQGRLFIASEPAGKSRSVVYAPLLELHLDDDFAIEPGKVFFATGDYESLRPVYTVSASPTKGVLYVGHVGSENITTVIDSASGEVMTSYGLPVLNNSVYSPDGRYIASIWPSGKTIRQNAEGEQVERLWTGGVAVHDLETGQLASQVNLTENRGLIPPWKGSGSSFFYLRNQVELVTYDTASGKIVSTIDLLKLTGARPAQRYNAFPTISSDDITALSMVSVKEAEPDFILVLNVALKSIVHKIPVGKSPTNIALFKSNN